MTTSDEFFKWRPGVLKKQRWEIPHCHQFLINCVWLPIDTRKLIEIIKAELIIREAKILALEEMIDCLEQKINSQPIS